MQEQLMGKRLTDPNLIRLFRNEATRCLRLEQTQTGVKKMPETFITDLRQCWMDATQPGGGIDSDSLKDTCKQTATKYGMDIEDAAYLGSLDTCLGKFIAQQPDEEE